jgi:hypothetical protein
MLSIVPMQAVSNHTFSAVIPFNDQNVELTFTMHYNEIGNYWFIDITQDDQMLLSAYPLIPAQDILEQFQYLGIGHAYIVPRAQISSQFPNYETLTTEWAVVWGDDELADE